jgi:hypothetical protein
MRKRQSQSTLIYVTIIALALSGLVTISIYYKRALQGKMRESADVFGHGAQYDPDLTTITENYEASGTPPPTGGWSWF